MSDETLRWTKSDEGRGLEARHNGGITYHNAREVEWVLATDYDTLLLHLTQLKATPVGYIGLAEHERVSAELRQYKDVVSAAQDATFAVSQRLTQLKESVMGCVRELERTISAAHLPYERAEVAATLRAAVSNTECAERTDTPGGR
jgi:hypothetical protein